LNLDQLLNPTLKPEVRLKRVIFFLLAFLYSSNAFGLILPAEDFKYRPFDGLIYYQDSNNKLNKNNLLVFKNRFKSHDLKVGNFGFTSDTIWAYVELWSEKEQKIYIDVEYGFHDEIELYHYKSGILVQVIKSGDLLKHQDRPLPTNGFAFPIKIDWKVTHEIFLKFKAQESLQVPVSILSESEYIKKVQRDQIYLGLLFGGIIALLLYNLFLWVATWEKAYLTYSVYILTHLIFQISYTAIGFQYLWSGSPSFHNISIPLTGMINIAAFTWFTRNYLRLSWKWEKMDKILMYTGYSSLLVLLIWPFVDVQTMIIILVIFHTFLAILVPFPLTKLIFSGDKVALYYLVAFGFLLIFVLFNVLAVFGLFSYSEFLLRSPQIGFLIEGVLLSLGLAYRINLLKKAKNRAEQEASDNRVYKDLSKLSNQVAHDLKSPMAALEVLGDDSNLSPEFKSMLQTTTDRISSIVNDLKINKVQNESQHIQIENLNKVIDELVQEKTLEYQERKDVKIRASLPFFSILFPIHLSSFQRVLSNMINNSIEAKSNERELIEINLILEKQDDLFSLRIKDNGIGIDPNSMNKIFEEGVSFNKDDGYGLGLFHAKKALELMLLNLRILDSNEKGTIFEIAPNKEHKSL